MSRISILKPFEIFTEIVRKGADEIETRILR
jgi:hypothetical protein